MASGADLYVDLGQGRARGERLAARADDLAVNVLGVNISLQRASNDTNNVISSLKGRL
jgi:hypothetical protein